MHILIILLGILFGHPISCVDALNTTIDNTSPLLVFSPTPCFQQDTPGCSPEWQLSESSDDYNGSTTSTTGPDAALGLTVVPRVSLVFQGSSIIFVPGQQSTAQATVVVDNLSSILVDTSQNAFSGTGLDPFSNHTIIVTFVPSNTPTILEVDYFIVEQPDVNVTTSVATSTLVPTPLPTALPSTTTAPPFTFTNPQPTQSQSDALSSPGVIPTGTIAAVTVCAAILVFLAGILWFLAVRRRRRRAALQREKAILYDLRLPSEIVGGNNNRGTGGRASFSDRRRRSSLSRVWRWGEEQRERRQREMQMQTQMESGEVPWNDADAQQRRDEKGKGRERTWRDSVLPPVHYTPRR